MVSVVLGFTAPEAHSAYFGVLSHRSTEEPRSFLPSTHCYIDEHLHSGNASPALLRVVHRAKKELAGEVMDPSLVDLEAHTNASVRSMLAGAKARFNRRTPSDTAQP